MTVLGPRRPQLAAQIHSLLPRITLHVAWKLLIVSPVDLCSPET